MDTHEARDIVKQLNATVRTLRDRRPTATEIDQAAEAIRGDVGLETHANIGKMADHRRTLLESILDGRRKDLLSKRRKKMQESPFAFLRGSAGLMAADLQLTKSTGVTPWICGDAHCGNFGIYGSAELSHVFDLSDFDEGMRGPWEWDVKRLAASLVVCARGLTHTDEQAQAAARAAVSAYRAQLAATLKESLLGRRLRTLRTGDIVKELPADMQTIADRLISEGIADIKLNFGDLVGERDGEIVFNAEKTTSLDDGDGDVSENALRDALDGDGGHRYIDTLSPSRRGLLRGFNAAAVAFKVVGVGSIGLRDFLVLLDGRDHDDLVVLQVKQASVSQLLERTAPDFEARSDEEHEGKRAVHAQTSMQAASDPLLGWTTIMTDDGHRHDYYVRQYRNMKGTIDPEKRSDDKKRPPDELAAYGALCGTALARAHARTGAASFINAYLGDGETFDDAITAFAVAYAGVVEADHADFAA